jgi:hypothetical protein
MVMDDAEGEQEAIVDHGHSWWSPSRPTVAFGTNALSKQIEGPRSSICCLCAGLGPSYRSRKAL